MLARVRTQVKRKRHCDRLRARLEASVELAVIDPLTGLFNRRYMETHVALGCAGASSHGRPLSLLLADIDHFKSVNDTHGQMVGDKVLRQVAQRLRRLMRTSISSAGSAAKSSWSLCRSRSLEDAMQVGERVSASIASDTFANGLRVTASAGVATLCEFHESVETLLQRVDLALYAAKQEGRNRVVADAA